MYFRIIGTHRKYLPWICVALIKVLFGNYAIFSAQIRSTFRHWNYFWVVHIFSTHCSIWQVIILLTSVSGSVFTIHIFLYTICIIPGWIYISCARYVGTLLFKFWDIQYPTVPVQYSAGNLCTSASQTLGSYFTWAFEGFNHCFYCTVDACFSNFCRNVHLFSLLILYNTWTWILHL